MAKTHLKNRIDTAVIEMADQIAEKLSAAAGGAPVTQGFVIEEAVKAFHKHHFPAGIKPKPAAKKP